MLNHLDELYTISYDFCKAYEKNAKNKALESATKKTKNRKCSLSLSQIVTILIVLGLTQMHDILNSYFIYSNKKIPK